MKMRMSKKLVLVIVLAVVAAGLAYLIFGLVYVPALAQFRVTGELAKTEYRAREQITVEPFLAYTGMRRQVTIYAGTPLFFVEVYTAENEKVSVLPLLDGVAIVDMLWSHTLRRNVPYNDEDRWREGITGAPVGHPYDHNILDYLRAYSFRLEQTGSYKVVVRAEFIMGEHVTSTVYSEPIWVQIEG
jgi:hypothetical protein